MVVLALPLGVEPANFLTPAQASLLAARDRAMSKPRPGAGVVKLPPKRVPSKKELNSLGKRCSRRIRRGRANAKADP